MFSKMLPRISVPPYIYMQNCNCVLYVMSSNLIFFWGGEGGRGREVMKLVTPRTFDDIFGGVPAKYIFFLSNIHCGTN